MLLIRILFSCLLFSFRYITLSTVFLRNAPRGYSLWGQHIYPIVQVTTNTSPPSETIMSNETVSWIRRVWRYQREVIRIRTSKDRQHNDQKKKGQRDKQRSTKHTHKTKDRVTRTPLITFIMYTKSRNNGKPNNFKKAR